MPPNFKEPVDNRVPFGDNLHFKEGLPIAGRLKTDPKKFPNHPEYCKLRTLTVLDDGSLVVSGNFTATVTFPNISHTKDNILIYGQDGAAVHHSIRTDINGRIQTILYDSAGNAIGVTNVSGIRGLNIHEIDSPEDQRLETTFVWSPLTGVLVQDGASTVVNVGDVGTAARRYNQLVLYIDYTNISATTLEVVVEFSPNNTKWIHEGIERLSNTNPEYARYRKVIHEIPGATDTYRIALPLNDSFYRLKARETGIVGGTVTIVGLVGRA